MALVEEGLAGLILVLVTAYSVLGHGAPRLQVI